MPVVDVEDGSCFREGTFRSSLHGKPIVFHSGFSESDGFSGWAVRPIVRVLMGRA